MQPAPTRHVHTTDADAGIRTASAEASRDATDLGTSTRPAPNTTNNTTNINMKHQHTQHPCVPSANANDGITAAATPAVPRPETWAQDHIPRGGLSTCSEIMFSDAVGVAVYC